MAVTVARKRKVKDQRIDVRVSATQKALLQRAARIETNGDVSEFMLACSEAHAQDIVREQSDVTADIRERFYELLLHPPEPTEALVALFADAASPQFRVLR